MFGEFSLCPRLLEAGWAGQAETVGPLRRPECDPGFKGGVSGRVGVTRPGGDEGLVSVQAEGKFRDVGSGNSGGWGASRDGFAGEGDREMCEEARPGLRVE